MPVHQITVAPAREGKSSPRSKDKHEGAKAPSHSGSRSSSISKTRGSTAGLGTATKTTATASSPQDISRQPRAVAVTTASQSTQKKKAVKRRHRRKKDVAGAVGCVETPAEGAPGPAPDRREREREKEKERGEEQPPRARRELPAPRPRAPPSDTTSEDEGGLRDSRSWSKERARRGRRSSRDRPAGARARQRGEPGAGDKGAPLELQSMGSEDEEGGGGGEKTRSLPEHETGAGQRRGGGGASKSEGGGGSRGRGRAGGGSPGPGGSSSLGGEDEQVTYQGSYQEKESGAGDTAVPTATKHCGVNGDTAQPVGSEDSDAEVCRICHCEGDEEYPLITPCWCTGSLRFVHQACLNQWIKSSDTRCCELCKYDFIMETQLKPLNKWERLHMTKAELRKILCSVVFHLLAISCVSWSVYILIKRTTEDFRLGKEDELWRLALVKYYSAEGVIEWPFWTKLTVVVMGVTSGLFFMYIQCAAYLQLWRRLKAFNRIITVQNCPEKGLHPPRDPDPGTRLPGDAVEVPVEPSPAPVPEEQTDSDLSVEAAVAPV